MRRESGDDDEEEDEVEEVVEEARRVKSIQVAAAVYGPSVRALECTKYELDIGGRGGTLGGENGTEYGYGDYH